MVDFIYYRILLYLTLWINWIQAEIFISNFRHYHSFQNGNFQGKALHCVSCAEKCALYALAR